MACGTGGTDDELRHIVAVREYLSEQSAIVTYGTWLLIALEHERKKNKWRT